MPTCEKCARDFPNFLKIAGKRRNLSKRRFCVVCSPFGENNRRDLTRYAGRFKVCSRCRQMKPFSDYYGRSDPSYKDGLQAECKPCAQSRQRSVMRSLKLKAIAYKGSVCERCGYKRCVAGLEFHHRDPSKKDFQISNRKVNRLTEAMKRELDKCALICANCHREEHCGRPDCFSS